MKAQSSRPQKQTTQKEPDTLAYEDMAIPLTRGQYAIIDPQDYDLIKAYKWQARYSKGNWYAIHSTTDGEITMHGLILGTKEGHEIDHINQNGLDNRRENLRFATKSHNRANVRLRKDSKSGYKGVCFQPATGMWRAYIQIDKKWKQIGLYPTAKSAAIAYNEVAKISFGEFAWLNPIH